MSVYIVTDRAAGLCKIGYSKTPLKRLTALRTGTIADLQLEAVIPATRQNERELHNRFCHLRRAREWFALGLEIDALIATFPSGHCETIKGGSALAQYLQATGTTLAEFAARTGLTGASVSRIAAGKQWPSAATMRAIVEATDGAVTAEALLEAKVA